MRVVTGATDAARSHNGDDQFVGVAIGGEAGDTGFVGHHAHGAGVAFVAVGARPAVEGVVGAVWGDGRSVGNIAMDVGSGAADAARSNLGDS